MEDASAYCFMPTVPSTITAAWALLHHVGNETTHQAYLGYVGGRCSSVNTTINIANLEDLCAKRGETGEQQGTQLSARQGSRLPPIDTQQE